MWHVLEPDQQEVLPQLAGTIKGEQWGLKQWSPAEDQAKSAIVHDVELESFFVNATK
ncbi:MAG: hypothetical protein NTY19_01755 [Planctomycetota bacterium]|nr:hypothetical protein [Planctomycetota bacterium]